MTTATVPETPCPEPGLYCDVPVDEYHNTRGWSKSLMWMVEKHGLQALMEFLAGKIEVPRTEAMDEGAACDMGVYERDEFNHRVKLGPVNEKTGKTYGWDTKKFEEARKAAPDLILLTDNGLGKVNRMLSSLRLDKEAWELVANPKAEHQVTLYWEHPGYGLPMKGRLDSLIRHDDGTVTIVDLKTARSVKRAAYRNQFFDQGYHVQLAQYRDGLVRLGVVDKPEQVKCVHVCVQKSGKTDIFPTAVYPISDRFLDIGLVKRNQLIGDIANALETGDWPPLRYRGTLEPAMWMEGDLSNTTDYATDMEVPDGIDDEEDGIDTSYNGEFD